MSKLLKVILGIAGALITAIIVLLIYFNSTYPDVQAPLAVDIKSTPEMIARGEYLANHVTVCMDCHSQRDWSKFSGPVKKEGFGAGGELFDENSGIPGTIYAKNITPAKLNNWTDGEIIRAIANGVNKDGEALFPIMPYYGYNHLSREDMYSIVSYIRTLKPVKADYPKHELDFPLNFIVKTLPIKEYNPVDKNDFANEIERGKYLTAIAGCIDCHTKAEQGEMVKGMEFAGGFEFKLPGGIVRSANITPDNVTGIGEWEKEDFIERFTEMNPDSNTIPNAVAGSYNTPMPWTMYGGMTVEDLGAIYEYLRTIPKVNNTVVRFTPDK